MEDGVMRSADRGANWVSWNFGLLDLVVMSLVVSPQFSDDETLFAGTESGLFYSSNGGRAWREAEIPSGYDPVMSLALSPQFGSSTDKGNLILAGCETQGLFRSDDGGRSWIRLGEEILDGIVQSILISPSYPHSPDILVVTDGKVFLSRNDGNGWEEIWQPVTSRQPAVCALIREGLETGRDAWLGLANGVVVRMVIP
jgi:photosystem II stability/assembly factor-like uncharacterized protein